MQLPDALHPAALPRPEPCVQAPWRVLDRPRRRGVLCVHCSQRSCCLCGRVGVSLTTRASRPPLRPGAELGPLSVGPGRPLPWPLLSVCVCGRWWGSTSDSWFRLGLTAAGTDGAVGSHEEAHQGRQRRGGDAPPMGLTRPAPGVSPVPGPWPVIRGGSRGGFIVGKGATASGV